MEDLNIKQLTLALRTIAEEKNLPEDTVLEVIEQAIAAADAVQAELLGLPLVTIALPEIFPPNPVYQQRVVDGLRQSGLPVEAVAFGDMFCNGIADYRRSYIEPAGWQCVFPLLGEAPADLVREILQRGITTHLITVDTSQCDAVIGEHMLVVLEILPDLGVGRRFQPGFEPRQHIGQRQLRRGTGIIVRQRQIGGFAGYDGKGNADQTRGEGVKAGRFGIESGERGGVDLRQPTFKVRPVEQGFVMLFRWKRERGSGKGGG